MKKYELQCTLYDTELKDGVWVRDESSALQYGVLFDKDGFHKRGKDAFTAAYHAFFRAIFIDVVHWDDGQNKPYCKINGKITSNILDLTCPKCIGHMQINEKYEDIDAEVST